MAGDHIDLASEPEPGGEPAPPKGDLGRPFLGIHFACCDVYARIYRNRTGTGYRGACPRCAKPVFIRIGPGGSHARFFTVY
jgi:hypothetical protein